MAVEPKDRALARSLVNRSARGRAVCSHEPAAASDLSSHLRVFYSPGRGRASFPGTNREVPEGEMGLIQVFDLANVRSVMAIQTEDLGIRRARI